MLPVVRELETEYSGRVTFQIIDYYADQTKPLLSQYLVRYHPGFVVLRPDGTPLPTLIGPQSKETLIDQIEAALA
jgi:hypothetical protein